MPQIQQQHKGLPTKWKIIILLVLFVISVGIGIWLFLYQREQDKKAVTAAIKQSQTLVLQAKYDAAIKLLQDAYPKAHSQTEQVDLYGYIGGASLTKGDYDAAQAAFKQMEAKQGLTYETARQLAAIASRKGSKAEAIDYYNKAIKLGTEQKPVRTDDEIAALKVRIQELQK